MVIDLLTHFEATPRGLHHSGQQGDALHDVVDCREHKHSQGPFRIVVRGLQRLASSFPTFCLRAVVAEQDAGIDHELLQRRPGCLLVEPLAARPLLLLIWVNGSRLAPRFPRLVKAIAEGLTAVKVQAHEPEDREHRAHGALVLVLPCPATGALIAQEVELQLWEGGAHVLAEVLGIIGGFSDPLGCIPGPVPIRLFALHEPLQHGGRGHGGGAARGSLRLGVRHGQAPLCLVLVGLGDVQEQTLRGHLPCLLEALHGLPAPLRDHEFGLSRSLGRLPPREAEVVAVWEPNDTQDAVLHVHDVHSDLIDQVDAPQPGKGPRVTHLLALQVRCGVNAEARGLESGLEAKALVEHMLHGRLPRHVLGNAH
mmetsp:Transcript_110430/g.356448  ORF Transcript_110430/g.356448 Transcript_110430/m.356448 type:complete len:368 (+) Transcript_110430:944-2047(+)